MTRHLTRRAWIALLTVTAIAALGARSDQVPDRIVSTSPSLTETLFALGLGRHVVGVSTFCRYPSNVTALPKVGTYLRPDVELIARLRPDLVLLQAGPNAAGTQLSTLGLKAAVIQTGDLPSVFVAIQQVSEAAGVAARGRALTGELRAQLDKVRRSVDGRPRARVLIIVGRRPGTLSDIIAVGSGSYLHEIAAIAGGDNVLATTTFQYPRISMETVIALAPDVIIDVGEMGESPADADRRRQATEALWQRQPLVKAVRDQHLFVTNDEAFTVPGPRIVNVARTMAKWFHDVEPR